MSLGPQHEGTLPDESARRLLMRAAELDGTGDSRLSIPQPPTDRNRSGH